MLEMINRARSNPTVEAARYSIDLNVRVSPGEINTAPKAPCAFHLLLIAPARKHSDWMLATDTFSHTGLSGSTPSQQASWAGHPHGAPENISWRGTSGAVGPKKFTESAHEGVFRNGISRVFLMGATTYSIPCLSRES